ALPHVHGHLHGHAHLPLHVEPARAPAGGHAAAAHEAETSAGHGLGVPLLNASSLLAFLTWFGAAGYLLLAVAGWPLLLVLPVAILAGLAAALLIGLFLGKIIGGERVMDPRAYRLEGTVARVTVSIPAGGVGEIVFTKAGARRSEAARSLIGRAIPRETEVVIVDYDRGVAAVQTLDELVRPSRLGPSGPEDAGALPGA
ncbi:MAG: hypothetical protein IRY97_03315, partial [Thermomicrobiaceae bacterium]|nr:hypothetical protein [Thermomicrobiaceae bacterium]